MKQVSTKELRDFLLKYLKNVQKLDIDPEEIIKLEEMKETYVNNINRIFEVRGFMCQKIHNAINLRIMSNISITKIS